MQPDETSPRSRGRRRRTAGRVALRTLAVLGAVVAVAAVGIGDAAGSVYPEREREAPEAASDLADVHDPAKPTVAIVLGAAGTNIADTLAPFEVLASTGALNVYTVAEKAAPVPLTGGVDLVPDLTFRGLDELLGGAPDAIVVPQLIGAGEPSTAPVTEWLERTRADGDPIVMSVCVGAEVLAAADMLDGRPATSHWLGLIGLRRNYPEVDWREGVRYVDDGDVVSTAGVLSGVDGALRLVERLVDHETAARAAREVAWPDYSPGSAAALERSRPGGADLVALLSASYRFDRTDMGVLLTDGVGEIELASAFRPYTELSYLAVPEAVTVDGGPIRSKHGLTFLPRSDLESAAANLDRLVVPGSDVELDELDLPEGPEPVRLHAEEGFAFDGALRDVAANYDVATARWVAKSLAYPVPSDLEGSAWPWGLTLRPVLVAAGAAAIVVGVPTLVRRRRSARR